MVRCAPVACAFSLVALLATSPSPAQQAAVKGERTLPDLPNSAWFFQPPREPLAPGKRAGLVVVLPGGDGTREFWPWVRDGLLAQAPADCAGVMLAAVNWDRQQNTIWPTAADAVPGMLYTTEQYVRAVVAAVEREYPIDAARRVVVAWSSSGPAIHPLMAAKDAPFQRAYIAMATWPEGLDLAAVKGRRYVLDQSPEDQTTIFQHVRDAHAALTKAGAVVKLSTYAGGHGWLDEPLPRLREGLRWLLSEEPAPKPQWPAPRVAKKGGKLVNQLANGGFEDGAKGWNTIVNSQRLAVAFDGKQKVEGKQALHLQKTGGAPLDLLVQSVELPAGKTVKASLRWRGKAAEGAFAKVWLYDAAGKEVHADATLANGPRDGKWDDVARSWPKGDAVRATVQLVMLGAGEVWIDDVVLTVDG